MERTDKDIFRLAPAMEPATLKTIADRLEFRATDTGYSSISQTYFDYLPLDSAQSILCLGCGTGVEVRALRAATKGSAELHGVDHSPELIQAAKDISAAQGLSNVTYSVGDAHHLNFEDSSFDIAVLHTLVSHVDDPQTVLNEAKRVTRQGGTVAVFDGDYASLTFGYPKHDLEEQIEAALMQALIANPGVMRDMPTLLKIANLDLTKAEGYLYANIGEGAFWANVPEAYAGVLQNAGALPPEAIEEWRAYQARAVIEGRFFAASNYYSFIALKR